MKPRASLGGALSNTHSPVQLNETSAGHTQDHEIHIMQVTLGRTKLTPCIKPSSLPSQDLAIPAGPCQQVQVSQLTTDQYVPVPLKHQQLDSGWTQTYLSGPLLPPSLCLTGCSVIHLPCSLGIPCWDLGKLIL